MSTNLDTLLACLQGPTDQDRSDPWPRRPVETAKSMKSYGTEADNHSVQTRPDYFFTPKNLRDCGFYHPGTFSDEDLKFDAGLLYSDVSKMYLWVGKGKEPFMIGCKEGVSEKQLTNLIQNHGYESLAGPILGALSKLGVSPANKIQERGQRNRRAHFLVSLRKIRKHKEGRYVLGTQKIMEEISRYGAEVREEEFAKAGFLD